MPVLKRWALAAVGLALSTGVASGQEYSVDPASPDGWSPAAVIQDQGMGINHAKFDLGLVPADDVDALSDGLDNLPWNVIFIPPAFQDQLFLGAKFIVYSVSRGTLGIPGGVVAQEVAGNGAPADKFQHTLLAPPFLDAGNLLLCDAPACGLTPAPAAPQSNIDALDAQGQNPGRQGDQNGLQFSLDAATAARYGVSPADILYHDLAHVGPFAIYATAAQLGLAAADDIDALAIYDQNGAGRLGPGDIVYVSLRAGSPTLLANGWSAADVIEVYPAAGGPFVQMAADFFDCLPGDDLDGLTITDPGEGESTDVSHQFEVPPSASGGSAFPGYVQIAQWTFGGCSQVGWSSQVLGESATLGRLVSLPTDIDRCHGSTTCTWTFSNATSVFCHPRESYAPGGSTLPRGRIHEITSPWVSLSSTPSTPRTTLQYDVLPSNRFAEGRIVLEPAVRWRLRVPDTSTPPPGDSLDVETGWSPTGWNSLGSWTWETRVMDLTPFGSASARDVQVRFRIADWGPDGFGHATNGGVACPGAGPFIDNVRIGREVVSGPVIYEGIDSRSQAQDAFPTQLAAGPGEHHEPTMDRFGTAAFSRGGDLATCGASGRVVTGDSIHVQVSDVRGAGGVTAVEIRAAIVGGPHAGKAPAPYVVFGNGFFTVVADSARDANGAVRVGHFYVDLDDTYLRGGDRLVYFWWAQDASGGRSSLPAGLSQEPSSVAAAEAATGGLFEISVLPAMNWSASYLARIAADAHGDLEPTAPELAESTQRNCILYVQMENARRRSGDLNRTPFMYALDRLGYRNHYDVYDLQGIGNTNNHLASRATVEQCSGYVLIVQDAGGRRASVLPDGAELDSEKKDQATWYRQYLAQGATGLAGSATLWSIGGNVASEKSANSLVAGNMGLTSIVDDQGLSLVPDVVGGASFTTWDGCTMSFAGDRLSLGGCPVQNFYDGANGSGGAIVTHRYKSGTTTGVGAIVANRNVAQHWNTVWMGFPWSNLRDAAGENPPAPSPPGDADVLASKVLGCVLPESCRQSPVATDAGDRDGVESPHVTQLHANVPNPFNPTTEIRFDLARPGDVSLRIYDAAGRRVRTLLDGQWEAGRHRITWDGRDEQGRPVTSGIYLYELRAAEHVSSRKMVVVQ